MPQSSKDTLVPAELAPRHNDSVVRSMSLADFCAFCGEMAQTAPLVVLESLYGQCVERRQEVDKLIAQSRKRKQAGQPFKDYRKYAAQIQVAMTALNTSATGKGYSLVRNTVWKAGPKASDATSGVTAGDCIELLDQAAALLSECDSDDTEAQAWLSQWETFQQKEGFPDAKKASDTTP